MSSIQINKIQENQKSNRNNSIDNGKLMSNDFLGKRANYSKSLIGYYSKGSSNDLNENENEIILHSDNKENNELFAKEIEFRNKNLRNSKKVFRKIYFDDEIIDVDDAIDNYKENKIKNLSRTNNNNNREILKDITNTYLEKNDNNKIISVENSKRNNEKKNNVIFLFQF